jgi:hypothetical protein
LLATFATKPQSSNIAETADTFNSVYLNRLRWSKFETTSILIPHFAGVSIITKNKSR